jgi:hypothetical protein
MRRAIPYMPAILLVGVIVATSSAAFPKRAAGQTYQYRSLMPAYWQFLRENQNAAASTLARFRTLVVTPNRDVFDAVAAGWMEDANLQEFIRRLEGKSQKLRQVDNQFPRRLSEAWQGFTKQVPDLKPGATVYLIPAPRAAVGGAVRPLGVQNAVIFGAEEISTVIESQRALNVLVQHEMTHLYHMQVNPEIRQMIAEVYMPPYATDRARLYQVLWLEGLAAYMSKNLNPEATDKEVLLSDSVAADVKALWPKIGADIREHLDSSKKNDIDVYLFDNDATGQIPKRAGYYVGMLVTERLARKYSFAELCRLSGPQLRFEVEQALRSLEKTGI